MLKSRIFCFASLVVSFSSFHNIIAGARHSLFRRALESQCLSCNFLLAPITYFRGRLINTAGSGRLAGTEKLKREPNNAGALKHLPWLESNLGPSRYDAGVYPIAPFRRSRSERKAAGTNSRHTPKAQMFRARTAYPRVCVGILEN